MEKPNRKLPEQSKSKTPDVKNVKGGSKTSFLAGSVEDSKENGVRVSKNGNEVVVGGDLGGGVVAVVKTKVVDTEIEVNDEASSENLHESDPFDDAENEVAGDCIDTNDGISLLVDVSSELGKEDSNDFYERENGGSLSEKRGNSDGKIEEMSDSEDAEEEDSSDGEYEFCVGDFVWGKIKSHPWWPGQIYDSSDASEYALKVKHRDRILVAYFDGTFAWCHPSQLKPFEKYFEKFSKLSSSKNFVNAVQKAVDEIGRLVELKMACSCVPKESLVGLARPLAANSGIKLGVLVPEGGIAKLWNYLFGPAECLTLLKHVAQVASSNNKLQLTELKGWLSAFYRVSGRYQLATYHDPQPIPGLEDNDQNRALDLNHDAAEAPIQGPVEEETNQSLLQKCDRDSENGQYQRRKQKSIAEIMEGYVDTRVKNVEDVMKEGTSLGNSAPLSSRKKRKGSDDASGGSNSSSKPKRRKVTKLLESTLATGSEIPSIETDGCSAKEETKKVLLSKEKKSKGSCIENDGQSKKETNASPVSVERKTVQRDESEAKEQTEKVFLSRERKKSKYLSPPFTSINKRQSKKDIEAESLKVSSESRMAERMTRAAVNLVGSESGPILTCNDEVTQKKDAEAVGADHEKSHNPSLGTQKLEQSLTIDTMKVKAPPNEVLSGIRCTAIDLYSLEKNNSLDVVEGFISTFRSSVYCNGPNYRIYKESQRDRKRKTPDSESVSSARYQNQTDQKSPEQRSWRTKMKNNEESKMMKDDSTKSDGPILKQAARTPDMKTKDRETDGKEKSDKPKFKAAARTLDMKTKDRETDGKGKSDKPKHKPAARSQDKKRKDKETDGKAAPAMIANNKDTDGKALRTSLFVTFNSGSSLPSKSDLIKIYSKFGALDEEETEMFYDNFCAQVVFLRSSDAEEAFKSSQLISPFAASNAAFELRNFSSTSKMRELKEISKAKPLAAKAGGKTLEMESAAKSSGGEVSPFTYLKQKLEMIASVLENSEGKISPELKSKLEGDVKDLLEKELM
ncbi:Serine/threonine-protein kinase ATM [Melia azedarach]|uniref:Serine/threonine-protein kinase ATM n=2 Tax=Melia azedarach TaxID=155640 RepID=A0ACC1YZN0_MELAZ|nr:Serine/threonine-protein kinase ATM [Melia azedarach]KAJ4729235.1 Serine/threonine-protein kinase ATM [Melia azedarach]